MSEFLLRGLRTVVEKTAAEFDPDLLTALTAGAAVTEWATIEKVACAAKLRAAARASDVGLDADQEVAEASGVTKSRARQQTKLKRKLRTKQKTDDAFNKGKVSATEANAIADAADANPDAEDTLLGMIEKGAPTSEVLAEAERIKRDALDADGSLAARQKQMRSIRTWTDAMGMVNIAARLEPIPGAMILAELQLRADQKFREQWKNDKTRVDTREQRMADAMAAVFSEGATASAPPREGSPRGRPRRRGPRATIHLLVTKQAFDRGFLQPGERCETADGRPVPLAAVDDLLSDPDTKVDAVIADVTDVQAIVTYKRYIPARIRDALIAKGQMCATRGCSNTRGLQIDHTDDFGKGGPTRLSNLKPRCRPCHDLKTRGLIRITEDGEWEPVVLAGTGARRAG